MSQRVPEKTEPLLPFNTVAPKTGSRLPFRPIALPRHGSRASNPDCRIGGHEYGADVCDRAQIFRFFCCQSFRHSDGRVPHRAGAGRAGGRCRLGPHRWGVS